MTGTDGPRVPDRDEIPEELVERDQWLMFGTSGEEKDRRPHWRGDFSASWTDPTDWHSFEEAREAARERDSWGIGYCFAKGNGEHPGGLYGALDLDGCVEEPHGTPKEWLPSLAPFADRDAYIEWSPSGRGLHIPLAGFEPPEWWADSHFTDDEHEGVEAYGYKFFTVTGDQLRSSGEDVAVAGEWVDEWLAQVYKSITGTDPRNTEAEGASSPPSLGGSSGRSGSHDEWMDAEIAREALEYVDPDVSYPTWRDIGFALADEFSDHTALSIFTDWSRGGSKWDTDAERQAKRIVEDATTGGGRTISTVVHYAKRGGWDASAAAREATTTATAASDGGVSVTTAGSATGLGHGVGEGESHDSTGEMDLQETIQYILGEYDEYNDVTKETVVHQAAVAIADDRAFLYPRQAIGDWRSKLHRYDDDAGIYRPDGDEELEPLCESLLGDFLTNGQMNELQGKIKRMSHARKGELETAPNRLVVANGILDLHTGELNPHTPEEYHRTRIDVEYHEDAKCPRIDEFLHEVVEPKDVPTLYQLAAHALYGEYIDEKAAMLVGDGRNGKSVFLDLLEHFVGEENVSHQSLQALSDNQFAAKNLHNRFANFHPDMSDEKIRDLGVFKKLTGRDTVDADVKFESPITFENYATLIFAANTMPQMAEDTHALWRRWIYINFPNTFDPDDDDTIPKRVLMRKLTAESELEGLLAHCVEELSAWHEGRALFDSVLSPDQVREKMKRASEPVYAFATACLEEDEDGAIPKAQIREVYRAYAREEDLPIMSDNVFGEKIVNIRDFPIENGRKRIDSTRTRVYTGVSWSGRGRQLAGLDELEDEQQVALKKRGTRERNDVVLEALQALGGDEKPVSRAMVLGRASATINPKQAEYAFADLRDRGVICQPADAGDDEWMVSN